MYTTLKLSIYEKAEQGIITESEKKKLLAELDSQYQLANFCEHYGLIPVDEDTIVFESIKAEIGKFIREQLDMKSIKEDWNKLAEKFTHSWTKKILDNESEKEDLKEAYEVLKREKLTFMEYKKNFVKIARAVNLSTDDIILENVVFAVDEESGKDKMSVKYSKGKQQVMIPNGTCLLHVSPVAGITEMRPAFRSKTVGKYMYPSPRCFFTLGKQIKPTKAGLENQTVHKYTPVDFIKTAYIDPTYTDLKTGSVYIETTMPIKVMDFNKRMAALFGESVTAGPSVDKFKQLIYESRKADMITDAQVDKLLEYLR